MLIYTLIGVLVSLTSLGSGFASQLSTHWIPNLLFFLLFLVFSSSFLGMFEIVLPGNIVNRADQQADKGGYLGIVFMALATVLVSFSCTGPIVGALLVEAAGGLAMKPILGMFGFGLAFALPFTFFAIFPSSLKSLPKSGGWLNSVKVVLGLVVLAFSMKFLVNIDQAYHLNIISREIFLAIWIAISLILCFYLLGKIKFAHDSDVKFISVPRLLMVIATFVFTIYLFTGFLGNNLTSINSLLPPASEKSTIASISQNEDQTQLLCGIPKYSDFLHLPFGLKGYFELDEALACAKQKGKPVFIDFKGHACSNCKKMEAAVFSKPEIQKLLKENFIIVALYADDRTKLVEKDWRKSISNGEVNKTMGMVNESLEVDLFKTNALPLYAIVDSLGKSITTPIGTELDAEKFEAFLRAGISKNNN
jgi:thiol:disulfide interchange protein DsbD